MALTKVSRGLLSTGIVDNSNATAITIGSDESTTFSGPITLTAGALAAAGNAGLSHRSADNKVYLQAGTGGFNILDDQQNTHLAIDSAGAATFSGELGIGGAAVPSATNYNGAALHVRQAGSSSVGSQLRLTTGATGHTASDGSFIAAWADSGLYITNQENAKIAFSTGGSERMQLDNLGNLLVNTTSNINFSGVVASHNFSHTTNNRWVSGFRNATTGSAWGIAINYSAASPNSTSNNFLFLTDSSALRCSVMSNGGVQNYQANDLNLSDRREKTNFLPAKSYLNVICAIPVQTFNYIDQNMEEDPSVTLGVVAQDVQTVAPELVTESNWGTHEDPKMRLSIYQTDFQYALMKSIQEQQATIEALTQRIETLENN